MRRFLYCITIVFFGWIVVSDAQAQMSFCATVQDPIQDMDIWNATGTFAVETSRADLIGASLLPEPTGYLASVSTSQPFRLKSGEKGNVVFMFDVDAKTENNSDRVEDVRGGSDVHYLVGPLVSDPTKFGVRRYVFSDFGVWSQVQTSSTAEVTENDVSIHIPRAELSLVDPTRWRAWISLGVSNEWTVRDGAPTRSSVPGTCGYLPVPDLDPGMSTSTGAVPPSPSPEAPVDIRPGLIALAIYVAFAGILAVFTRRRT